METSWGFPYLRPPGGSSQNNRQILPVGSHNIIRTFTVGAGETDKADRDRKDPTLPTAQVSILGISELRIKPFMVRERLGIDRPLVVAGSGTQILDKREKEAVNLVARASGEGRAIVRPHPAKDPFEPWEMTAQEREVANKYVRLIQYHCPTRYTHSCRHSQRSDDLLLYSRPLASEEETPGEGERLFAESLANSSQHDLMSPEPRRPQSLVLEQLPHLLGRLGQGSPSPPSPVSSLLPDLEEIRVSPCIAKKGHLNVLEEKSKGWKKRWVVVRRPYVFIFRDERWDKSFSDA